MKLNMKVNSLLLMCSSLTLLTSCGGSQVVPPEQDEIKSISIETQPDNYRPDL